MLNLLLPLAIALALKHVVLLRGGISPLAGAMALWIVVLSIQVLDPLDLAAVSTTA